PQWKTGQHDRIRAQVEFDADQRSGGICRCARRCAAEAYGNGADPGGESWSRSRRDAGVNARAAAMAGAAPPRLGLRENIGQFGLLILVNAFVGAVVGMERSILPAIAQADFHLAARAAVLSFIVVFGVTKALTNYFAGRFSDRFGRKRVLVAGWLIAAPVPLLLMWSTTWDWILLANAL